MHSPSGGAPTPFSNKSAQTVSFLKFLAKFSFDSAARVDSSFSLTRREPSSSTCVFLTPSALESWTAAVQEQHSVSQSDSNPSSGTVINSAPAATRPALPEPLSKPEPTGGSPLRKPGSSQSHSSSGRGLAPGSSGVGVGVGVGSSGCLGYLPGGFPFYWTSLFWT